MFLHIYYLVQNTPLLFIPPGNISFFSFLQDAQKTMYESYYSRSKSFFEVTSHNHKKAQTTTDKARTPPTRPICRGTWIEYHVVLYCTVLYCTALYCTVLYCTVPCCRPPLHRPRHTCQHSRGSG